MTDSEEERLIAMLKEWDATNETPLFKPKYKYESFEDFIGVGRNYSKEKVALMKVAFFAARKTK